MCYGRIFINFFKKVFIAYSLMCIRVCCRSPQRAPTAGLTGDGTLPGLGARSWALVLWKATCPFNCWVFPNCVCGCGQGGACHAVMWNQKTALESVLLYFCVGCRDRAGCQVCAANAFTYCASSPTTVWFRPVIFSRPAWSTWWVPNYSGLQSETQFQNKILKKKKNHKNVTASFYKGRNWKCR